MAAALVIANFLWGERLPPFIFMIHAFFLWASFYEYIHIYLHILKLLDFYVRSVGFLVVNIGSTPPPPPPTPPPIPKVAENIVAITST